MLEYCFILALNYSFNQYMILFFLFNMMVCFGYLLLIGWISNQWDELDEVLLPIDYKPKNAFSIIIPFRNEKGRIDECIQSLQDLNENSPIYEIIAVNDHSDDEGGKGLSADNLTLINASAVGKKNAITQAVSEAKYPWIITIDADCIFHTDWLKIIDQGIEKYGVNVLVGGVKIKEEESLISRFQFMDFASTMGITAAGLISQKFYLCNGANFIYQKSLFDEVGGFRGNESIASGDDVFLLSKFTDLDICKVLFLKSDRGAAATKAEVSIYSLFLQRKRWATKTKAYASSAVVFIQGYVFVLAVLIVLDIFVLPFIIGSFSVITGVFLLFLKSIIDFLYLSKMVKFYEGKKIMKGFVASIGLYIIYIITMGMMAIIPSKVSWKGRKV